MAKPENTIMVNRTLFEQVLIFRGRINSLFTIPGLHCNSTQGQMFSHALDQFDYLSQVIVSELNSALKGISDTVGLSVNVMVYVS